MNISKYCNFLLEEKISKKTNSNYYCISITFGDFSFPIIFLTKKKYDEMISSLGE